MGITVGRCSSPIAQQTPAQSHSIAGVNGVLGLGGTRGSKQHHTAPAQSSPCSQLTLPAPQILVSPAPGGVPGRSMGWGEGCSELLPSSCHLSCPASAAERAPSPSFPHGFLSSFPHSCFLLLLLLPLSLPPLCLRDIHNSPVKYIQCKYIKSRRLPAAYVFME